MGINLLNLQAAENHMKIKGSERPGQPQLFETILYPLSFPFTKLARGSKGINVQYCHLFPDLQRRQRRNKISCSSPGTQLLRLTATLLAVGGGGDPTAAMARLFQRSLVEPGTARCWGWFSAVWPLLCSLTSVLSGCE